MCCLFSISTVCILFIYMYTSVRQDWFRMLDSMEVQLGMTSDDQEGMSQNDGPTNLYVCLKILK